MKTDEGRTLPRGRLNRAGGLYTKRIDVEESRCETSPTAATAYGRGMTFLMLTELMMRE